MARNVVPHRNRSIDRGTRRSAVCEKFAWFLILHFALALHVTKKLDRGYLAMLSLKTHQRNRDHRYENRNDQKILNHSRKSG
jgi:hypothetical protein